MKRGGALDEKRNIKLEDIYRKYAEGLYYYLLRLSGSPTVAEELVQETFYRATISLSSIKHQEVKPWLFKIARNIYIDEWRKRQRWKWVPFFEKEEMISPYGIPEAEAVKKENKKELKDLLALLPENYRTILYFREYEDFTYQEIQEAMELSESQVKVTLFRARKRLKELAENVKGESEHDGMDKG
ncbi:sigma-70 family RNA polymerase sigma factor [Neobacillus novalis]|uniref:Sigma-70 family RNA polymerase sigma factor n=1 Tax=Neobacillus novalis TaxID=220687 RepID=A0AA95MJV1_9BACI|nr:sigma-70 family RNA polymerase sigma factor [Neobacillus novalis]WHY85021.1 sigma-70 family RNA polymerase sigma factor [Neobacillus novalis]